MLPAAYSASSSARRAKSKSWLREGLPQTRAARRGLVFMPSIEHENLASHFASFHRAERLVQIVQAHTPSDHLVELQPALHVEVDVLGHIDLEVIGAHAAALDLLFAQEDAAFELDLLAHRDHADDGGRPAGAQRLEALLGSFLESDGFEGVLHATIGQLSNLFDGIQPRGVDGVGRAKLVGSLELVIVDVDADDHARPGDARALDR